MTSTITLLARRICAAHDANKAYQYMAGDRDGYAGMREVIDFLSPLARGSWRHIETNIRLKGQRISPKYYPAIGEVCRMSGPNCDNADGYTWAEVEVLWTDDFFIVTRTPGCWPTITKLELVRFEPITPKVSS